MPEMLPHVLDASFDDGLRGYAVLQYMRVGEMFWQARGCAVLAHEVKELLPGDGEDALITEHFAGVIKKRLALIQQWLGVRDQLLRGLERSLQALHSKKAVLDAIPRQCNYFRCAQAVIESDDDHQPVTLSVRSGGAEQRQ